MRRNETDFIGPEHHDILASVEILEMSMSGEYVPADVVDETFQLHQGLQRRIGIKLHHTSGHALPWTRFSHVSISDIRVLAKGVAESVSQPEVELKIAAELDFAKDGTSTLLGTGTWDTASHDAVQLNRKTAADQQILVRLVIMVDVENLDEPATLSLDLPIRILDRDARRSSFKFWSTAKAYPSLTAIFAIRLTPPLAQSASDLWRLDTARKHVPGEEVLADWKPRSLSLLEDHERLKGTARRMGDVQATKAVLEQVGEVGLGPVERDESEQEAMLRRCVGLWEAAMQQRVQVSSRTAMSALTAADDMSDRLQAR
jgi:kinesin family protein 1